MIISHKLKCIYIKNVKVIGSSFEVALSKYCREDDVITPMEGIISARKFFSNYPRYYSPRNYKISDEGKKFYNHIPASKIKTLVPSDVWNNYLKIATIRCPYDVAISMYYWKMHQKTIFRKYDFSDYVTQYESRKCHLYFPRIHIKKKLITDFLIRHEHLNKDIKELETKINCPGLLNTFLNIDLKTSMRPKEGTTPCEIYSKYPATKSKIDKLFYEKQNEYEFVKKILVRLQS